MKINKLRFFLTVVLSFSFFSSNAQTEAPQLVNRNKAGILAYFDAIVKQNMIIVGQQTGDGKGALTGYDKYIQALDDSTGKTPALAGFEYGLSPRNDLNFINSVIVRHWNKGGLVTISWHADNPFVKGYNPRWNSVVHKDSINLQALLKNAPDSPEKDSYRAELEKVGQGLLQLQKEGVTVLWRPFHEMNGTWFWWGVNNKFRPTNQADYIALWKDAYNYFTADLGLKNLIWIYSIDSKKFGIGDAFTEYPGDNFVDVVGIDSYNQSPGFDASDFADKVNKPFVLAEVGPNKRSLGRYNEQAIIDAYKGKAAYFLQWSSWKGSKVAIVDNPDFRKMVASPSAVTLDKLNKRRPQKQ